MEFIISKTFTESLGNLTGDEQKACKTTAFDLQLNPANLGMKFHRIEKARDPHFWSVRVGRDLRIIVHKTDSSFMLCYVDHHDDAYRWAEMRKIERHPKTGAAQLVKIREIIKEITKFVEVEQPASPKAKLFENTTDEELLGFGVPEEWLGDVKQTDEDSLLDIAEHLPQEASEALLELATGGTPQIASPLGKDEDPFKHPDAQRRFRVMTDVEELRRALEYPWDKWMVFLHPAQRSLVERDFSGPARVFGSAGTGKTIVALHRSVHLTKKNKNSRVLLATFSETLANALRNQLRRLISHEPRLAERLEIHSLESIGKGLYKKNFDPKKIASEKQIKNLLKKASSKIEENKFSGNFLWSEWSDVVDPWQLKKWEEYRDIQRLGRKKRLSEGQRKQLWQVFDDVLAALNKKGIITKPDMFNQLSKNLTGYSNLPFEFIVVDEAQDISVPELKFLAALGGDQPNSLFFTGDLGQRIFQQPFSWKSLGLDIRGRSQNLKVNYRISHQIRSQADLLLPGALSDVDGNEEIRRGTISVFNGTPPTVEVLDSPESESRVVCDWLKELQKKGYQPGEIGVFVRSEDQLQRATSAVKAAGLPLVELDEKVGTRSGHVSVSTMHLAKGLEFRAVVVMACDDEIIPLQERIEAVSDDSDLDEAYQTERHLLYVACTRARDNLLVTGVDPASEFLEDLRGK